jgi:hypothetical protein
MTKSLRSGVLSLAVVAACAVPALGQTQPGMLSVATAPSSAATTSAPAMAAAAEPALDDLIDQAKHPFAHFTWGADQRIRQEYFNNAITLNGNAPNHEYNFGRYRTRVWASFSPSEYIDLNVRMIWEWWYFEQPQSRQGPQWDQAEIDLLNATFKIPPANAFVTVGRQEMTFGNAWLVMDGTPLDGSTTLYFDALRGNIAFKDIKTVVDAIYINQYSDPDMWLQTMGDTDCPLIEQNERGTILNVKNTLVTDTTLEGYFIYKHDEKVLVNGDNGDIYTLGGRGEHLFTSHIRARLEGAYQFGDKNSKELSAWGSVGRVTYAFQDGYDNQLFMAGEALSGRKANDSTDGQFDPLWGRWPQFSEIWIYADAGETRLAETTNLLRFGPGWEVHPTPKMTFVTTYNAMWSDTTPLAGTPGFGTGNFRGNLFTTVLKYKFNKHLAGHLIGEMFVPGDYYVAPRDSPAFYGRFELVLTY